MKNISKLLNQYKKFQGKADSALSAIEMECQKHSEMELHLFYQPGDGLVFNIDREETNGFPMNVPLSDFRCAVDEKGTLTENDLNELSI